MKSLARPSHVLVKRALAVSAPIISISICYIGQFQMLIFPKSLRNSSASTQRTKFAPGACPTSQPEKWKTYSVFQGDRCATNQVSYSIGDRAIERDLLPWCEQHAMP